MKIRAYFCINFIEIKRREQKLSRRQFSKLITQNNGKYVSNFYHFLLKREFTDEERYIKAIIDWYGSNKCITFMILTNNEQNMMITPYKELFNILDKKTKIEPINLFGYQFYIKGYSDSKTKI